MIDPRVKTPSQAPTDPMQYSDGVEDEWYDECDDFGDDYRLGYMDPETDEESPVYI
jgi:hypothetical protein